jgi:oligosaccharide translocation protein RFT1
MVCHLFGNLVRSLVLYACCVQRTSVPVGVAFAVGLGLVWRDLLVAPDLAHYPAAIYVYAACAVLELLVEPLWVAAQITLQVKLKVVAEGAALAVRCLVTLALVVLWPALGLLAFCTAQLAYSATIVAVYYGAFFWQLSTRSLPLPLERFTDVLPAALRALPNEPPSTNLVSTGRFWFQCTPPLLRDLVHGFFLQSLLKNVLTEGERYIMTFAGALDFGEQGVYDIVNNLGSLVARFLFQV